MSFSNQTILVTGAAGLIGSAISKKLFDSGATVLLTDISSTRLNQVFENLSAIDQLRVHSVCGDISTSDGIDSIFAEFAQSIGPITGAVHCAYPRSSGWGNDFYNLQADDLFYDLNKQLGGAILFSQKILSHFNNNGGGSLVHLSSIQGIRAPKFDHYVGTQMTSPIEYAAIKAGIISITSWLARFCSNKNIRVNCVSPGGVLDNQPDSFLEKYRSSCCNIGMLSPEHVASGVAYLLSSDAFAINGQNLIVDDGWSL